MIRWLQDQILAAIQRRCDHPGEMVTADVLEGCVTRVEVKHCRRCGAVKPVFASLSVAAPDPIEWAWTSPSPNLWRGR